MRGERRELGEDGREVEKGQRGEEIGWERSKRIGEERGNETGCGK